MTCRECPLSRDENLSEPKSRIRWNTKIGPVLEVTTCCLQCKYRVKIRNESVKKTILTRRSEFLMTWTSWSQTWATKRTKTTSRKLLRCSSKVMRWKRMYLLLRADQRPKQNHEDVLLLAHLQELYPSGKDLRTDIESKTYSSIA